MGAGQPGLHSVLLMDGLQRAALPFEMMAYPVKKHGIRDQDVRTHLFEMNYDFLKRSM